jgi:hypothetical protein
MSLFILDTNCFIQSHRVTYPLDVVPTFWEKLKSLSYERKIISIDKVRDEIFKNDDELKEWIEKNLPEDFFQRAETQGTTYNYGRVSQWADSKKGHYLEKAIKDFLKDDNADAWLIAYALTINEGCIIVTQEKSEPNRKSKIKIPDVCIAFGLPYKNLIEMFRMLGEKF